jgi:hypothetical protein
MVCLTGLQDELSVLMKDAGVKLKEYQTDQTGYAKSKEKFDKDAEKGKGGKRTDQVREKMEAAWKKVQNSRNDYLLALQYLNVCKDRYFKVELPALVDKLDTNFHMTFRSVFESYRSLSVQCGNYCIGNADALADLAKMVDSKTDKVIFFKSNNDAFAPAGRFTFIAGTGETITTLVCDETTSETLANRFRGAAEIVHNEELSIGAYFLPPPLSLPSSF